MQRVLIIEDEVQIAELIREVLADEGYRTDVARDGREGLSCLAEFQPHLIVCDVMMPVMGGVEFARALQDDPAHRAIPLILMSAGGPVPRAEQAGHVRFLRKPFDLSELLDAIRSLLAPA